MNAQTRLDRILRRSGLAAVLICSSGSLAATPPVDGDWKASSLVAAAHLQETFYNSATMSSRQGADSSDFAQAGEEMVDTFFSGEFSAVGRDLTFSGGTLSGDVSGSYTLGTQGRVRLSVEGDTLTAYVNVSGDTMILPLTGTNDVEGTVVTRLPATLTHADLAGDWTVVGMKLPDDLTETYFNTVSETTRQGPASTDFAQANEILVDVFFVDPPEVDILSFTLDSLGNITGDITGTSTINGDRTVTLNITGGGSVTLAPNAGANVLASVEVESGSRRLNAVVKAPPTLNLADFAGVWRGQFLRYPARLREVYYNSVTMTSRTSADSSEFAGPNEDLVDVFLSSQAESENDLLNIDAMGNVSGASEGTLSISGSALTFTPGSGEPPVTVYPNAATDVLITGEVSDDDLAMINLVKVSATPSPTFDALVDLEVTILPGGEALLTWNEGSNFRLVKSTTLDGQSWTEVSGTKGTGSYEDPTPVPSAFYRIESLGD